MAIFVLVHGACHGGWCWRKLTPFLRKSGHEVYTPTLTGLGERSHLLTKDIGLYTHIQDILQILEYEDLKKIILVGHSYGTLVIGGVAEQIAHRIRHLVYLDGYIPEDGKCAFDLIPGTKSIAEKRLLTDKGLEGLIASYEPEDWGVTDPQDVAWMKARLCPMPFRTYEEVLSITNADAKKLRRSYISCTKSHVFRAEAERAKKGEGGWHYYHELNTGHDAMITSPEELANVLHLICTGKPNVFH